MLVVAEELLRQEGAKADTTPVVAPEEPALRVPALLAQVLGQTRERLEHMVASLVDTQSSAWLRVRTHIADTVRTDTEGFAFIEAASPFMADAQRKTLEEMLYRRIIEATEPRSIADLHGSV